MKNTRPSALTDDRVLFVRLMEKLEAQTAKEGLRFQITNEAQWMMPHYLGDPHFELAQLN